MLLTDNNTLYSIEDIGYNIIGWKYHHKQEALKLLDSYLQNIFLQTHWKWIALLEFGIRNN